MSADNQIVIVAHRFANGRSRYAAMEIQNPFDLLNPPEESAFNYAKACCVAKPQLWFQGTGSLERAKGVADLIAEEYRVSGWILEYEDVLFIEISEADRNVYRLDPEGERL